MTYVGSKPANKPVNQTDIEDDAISLAKLAGGTDGNIISYDASGNPVAIATGNDGQVLTSTGAGSPPAFEAASGTTINNNADNRIITGSGTANTLEGETNLTWDDVYLELRHSGDGARGIKLDANRGAHGDSLGYLEWQWNNTTVAKIESRAGPDTTNKDDAHLSFYTTASGGSLTERMKLNHSGVLGLGASTDGDLGSGLHIKKADSGGSVMSDNDALVLEGSAGIGMTLLGGHEDEQTIAFGDNGDSDIGFIKYHHAHNYMAFGANAGQKMSIRNSNANSGSLAIGSTSWDTWYHFQMRFNGNAGGAMVLDNSQTDTNGTAYIQFKQGNSAIGYISRNGTTSGVTYSTSSDYRLKDNVSYDFDATTKLKELKPAKFSWKADPSNQIVDGFLAHEVSSIVPEAITGTKDETETKEKVVISSDGTITAEWIEEADWIKGKADNTYEDDTTWEATKVVPKYQAIDQSKLVPLLVKTIQELEARIKTLEDA